MANGAIIPIALGVVTMLLLQNVNAGTIMVQSSASSFSNSCDGMHCPSGHSCSVSFSAIGDNSTKVKSCSDFSGNFHREEIMTMLIGNLECTINTTNVNGEVTTTKNCNEISPEEMKEREEEWEKQMSMVTEGEEKFNSLMESQQHAWERQEEAMDRAFEQRQKAMDQAFEQHEKALEQAMLQRERMWTVHQKAINRQLERLADLRM